MSDRYLEYHAAVVAGDVEAMRRALGDPPEFPNVRDECGCECLVYAIYHGPAGLVRTLLTMGADPDPEVDDGFPSLFAAIDRSAPDGHEVLTMLLEAGASAQRRGINDYTALHHAACRDDVLAVELLLAHGADPAARTRIDGYATPLEEAERFGHGEGAAALRRWLQAGDR